MSDGTSIEWAHATWQPVLGCTRVDHRCDRCYAINVVHRGMSPQHKGLTKLRPKTASRPGVDWNGKVRLQPDKLVEPLRWRKPRRVFVCSLADLFHPSVPFHFIAAVFGIMSACPQHTFLLLTKRIGRALEFLAWLDTQNHSGWKGRFLRRAAETWMGGRQRSPEACLIPEVTGLEGLSGPWPLPNVQLGVSVSDQETADDDISVLLECNAAVRWVSYEPALGPVDFTHGGWLCCGANDRGGPHIDWIVVGGESGPGARPFNVEWARDVVAQCRGTGTRVFVKQLGAKPIDAFDQVAAWPTHSGVMLDDGMVAIDLRDSKGGDMDEWPAEIRVREVM